MITLGVDKLDILQVLNHALNVTRAGPLIQGRSPPWWVTIIDMDHAVVFLAYTSHHDRLKRTCAHQYDSIINCVLSRALNVVLNAFVIDVESSGSQQSALALSSMASAFGQV